MFIYVYEHRAHATAKHLAQVTLTWDVTGCRRPTGCLIFTGHFPQKSPILSGSFATNDLQLKASYGSLPPCSEGEADATWCFYKLCIAGATWLFHKYNMQCKRRWLEMSVSDKHIQNDLCICQTLRVRHDSFMRQTSSTSDCDLRCQQGRSRWNATFSQIKYCGWDMTFFALERETVFIKTSYRLI